MTLPFKSISDSDSVGNPSSWPLLTWSLLWNMTPLRTLRDLTSLIITLNFKLISTSLIESQSCPRGHIQDCNNRTTAPLLSRIASWRSSLLVPLQHSHFICMITASQDQYYEKWDVAFPEKSLIYCTFFWVQVTLWRPGKKMFKKCLFSLWIAKLCVHIQYIFSSSKLIRFQFVINVNFRKYRWIQRNIYVLLTIGGDSRKGVII